MLLRIPMIQPIGPVIISAIAGSTLCWKASEKKSQFQPGELPPPYPPPSGNHCSVIAKT